MFIQYSAFLPLFIQNTVDAECARTGDTQQQVAASDGQVFHKHQRVHAFSKVAVEDERGQQGEACGEQRGGTGQETEQDCQTAAKLKQDGQRQQEPWDAHRFHVLLRTRIPGDFAPASCDKQNWHQNTSNQETDIF